MKIFNALSAGFLLAILLGLSAAADPIEIFIPNQDNVPDGENANGFEVYGNGLFWWVGDSGIDRIHVRGVVEGQTHTPVEQCCYTGVKHVSRDDAWVYFTSGNRRYRKPLGAAPGDPANLLQPGPLFNSTPGALTVWNGQLCWTESSNTGLYVHVADPDSSDSGLVAILNAPGVKKIIGFAWRVSSVAFQDALFMLRTDGTLSRLDINPSSGSEVMLATGISDFVVRNESTSSFPFNTAFTSVFAVQDTKLIHINLTTGQLNTSFYQAIDPVWNTPKPIRAVAEDRLNLYVIEQDPVSVVSPTYARDYIFRRLLRVADGLNSNNQWGIFASGSYSDGTAHSFYRDLRSEGPWLYCMENGNVERIKTNASLQELDFAPSSVEIVQTMQNLYGQVPLVAGKPAVLRAYAFVARNTTGFVGPFLTGASLRGWRDGIELPGSPLTPVNSALLDTVTDPAQLRSDDKRSFVFDLPGSWIQPGSMVWTLTINPAHAPPEMGNNPFQNNTLTMSGPFLNLVSVGKPCLVFKPVRTASADYSNVDPGFGPILERAKSLLPLPDFKLFWRSGNISKPVVRLFPPGLVDRPFQFPDDDSLANFYTALNHAFESDPAGCPDTHYVGVVPAGEGHGFSGIGGLPGLSLSDLVPNAPPIPLPATALDHTAVVCMEGGSPYNGYGWQSVIGGIALAHELSHNWGQKHIDQTLASPGCGNQKPKRPWQPYPYNPCTLGPTDLSNPLTEFGYDPVSHSAIIPYRAGDLMSYADSRWTSRYTWQQLLWRVPAGPTPPPLLKVASIMVVQGVVDAVRDSAELWPFYQATTGFFDPLKVQQSMGAATKLASSPYVLRLLDGAGVTLSQTPVVFQGLGEGAADQAGFLQFIAFPPQTKRIQLVHGASVRAERWVSAHAPTLSLLAPTIDVASQSLELNWNAQDADGDPLLFTIQYSPDNGISWQTLAVNYALSTFTVSTRSLPGSVSALMRVIATDGANSAVAVTGPFTLSMHAPVASIIGVREGQRLPFGSWSSLHGLVMDAEDGSLDASGLQWTLVGPVSRVGAGGSFSLGELTSGSYAVTLSAHDLSDQLGTATINFEILPLLVPEGPTPVLDGSCADSAYANAPVARLPLGDGQSASVRFVHSGSDLYVCFSDLRYSPTNAWRASAGIRVDVNASADTYAQTNDLGFFVDEDGVPSQQAGNGLQMTTSAPRQGFAAVVHRGTNAWSAELKISDGLLGGWNHAAGLMLSHNSVTLPNDNKSWPPSASPNGPFTWAAAYFGTNTPAPANRAPFADAGPDRSMLLTENQTLTLDGSNSYDPDGDPLSFSWTQVSGPPVVLQNATSVRASFVTPSLSNPSALAFRLIVSDGPHASAPALTRINLKPLAAPSAGTGVSFDPTNHGLLGRLLWPGQVGDRAVIEASTNLVNWIAIATNSADLLGQLQFNDPDATHFAKRFYHARSLAGSSQVVYSNQFAGAVGTEWSLRNTSVTPVGNRQFLGEFGTQTVSLSLSNLPSHSRLSVSLDLFVLKTWDGNDLTWGPDTWDLAVAGGPVLLHTTFSHQWPQSFPGQWGDNFPARSGAIENNTLGYGNGDSVYHLNYSFDHTATSVRLDFTGFGLQAISDESWGLDNVGVVATNNP